MFPEEKEEEVEDVYIYIFFKNILRRDCVFASDRFLCFFTEVLKVVKDFSWISFFISVLPLIAPMVLLGVDARTPLDNKSRLSAINHWTASGWSLGLFIYLEPSAWTCSGSCDALSAVTLSSAPCPPPVAAAALLWSAVAPPGLAPPLVALKMQGWNSQPSPVVCGRSLGKWGRLVWGFDFDPVWPGHVCWSFNVSLREALVAFIVLLETSMILFFPSFWLTHVHKMINDFLFFMYMK